MNHDFKYLRARGLNHKWIQYLNTIVRDLNPIQEGDHYIVCRECNTWHSYITPSHLGKCCGLTLEQYRGKYPGLGTNCRALSERRKKTDAQKIAQSEKLKARFQTAEGQITRQQIGEASKRMQASEYGKQAATHLRQLNADPDQKRQRSKESKDLWASPEHRVKIATWQAEHRDEVLESARHARDHLKSTSQLHLRFKEALDKVVPGFLTEHKVGWYSIDEAHPELKIAVEVDGCYWHGCEICGFPGTKRVRAIDSRKQGYLLKHGWTILRIPEHEIQANIDVCTSQVIKVISDLWSPSVSSIPY